MATLAVQAPFFRNTGANKEPVRLSRPIATGATFLEHDFVIQIASEAAPAFNGTQLSPPTSIEATIANSGGTIAAGTYQVAIGYVNANGTTVPGPTTAVTTTGTGLLTVQSPPESGDAIGYQLYTSAANLLPLYKQGTTVAFGTAATLSAPPSTATAAPTTNTTGLAAPGTPALAAGGTGGPAARTEYYILTYVNEAGETVGSVETSQALTNGQLVTVTAPGVSGDATGYNVYASTTSGQEVRQNAAPIGVTVNFVEPATGLVTAGVQRAAANQAGTVNGLAVLLGLADHDYNSTYGGPVGGVQPGPLSDAFGRPTFNKSVFGVTEVYPGISTEPQNAHVVQTPQYEISLLQAWDPGMAGQQCGLAIDAGSNFFVADLTASNKTLLIVEPVDGPGHGGPGDVYKRIAVKILPAAQAQ